MTARHADRKWVGIIRKGMAGRRSSVPRGQNGVGKIIVAATQQTVRIRPGESGESRSESLLGRVGN